MCLNCPKAKCNNCLSSYRDGGGASTRKLLKLKELCEQYDMTDRQMAEILGVSFNTVGLMRKKLDIPSRAVRKAMKEKLNAVPA